MKTNPTEILSGNTQYDQSVIQIFADALYTQARTIIGIMTFLGAAIGAAIGYFVGDDNTKTMFAIVGAVICGLIGLAVGRARAFALKLQAQTALCQMHIEKNTRK